LKKKLKKKNNGCENKENKIKIQIINIIINNIIKRIQKTTLQENRIEVAIITGRTSNILKQRASELGVAKIHQGVADKLSVLNLIMEKHSYSTDEVAYAGDDLPDLSALQAVGLSFSVPNAHPKIKKVVDIVTNMQGGWGAVREMSDFILESKGNCQAI